MGESLNKQNWWTRLDERFERKRPELWKFVKWNIMGALSTVVEVGAYALMRYVLFKNFLTAPIRMPPLLQRVFELVKLDQGKGYLYAFLISITLGYIAAYILNRKLSFKSNSNVVLSSLLYTLNVVVVILVGSWVGTKFSVFLAQRDLLQWDFLAKIVQMLVPAIWAYPLNRFVIFPKKKEGAPPPTDIEQASQQEKEVTVHE